MSASLLSVFSGRDLLTDCLLPQLSLFDIFSLFLANAAFRAAYKRKYQLAENQSATQHLLNLRIERALTMFFGPENMRVLCGMMNLGQLFLTGGLLLALIQGDPVENCEDADFATVFYYEIFRTRTERGKERIMLLSRNFVEVEHVEESVTFYQDTFAVDLFLIRNRKLQIITLDPKRSDDDASVVDNYCASFDFTFCANYFSRQKLVILRAKDVKERSTNVLLWAKNFRYRHFIDSLFQKRMENAWSRICKYRARGYHIVFDASTPSGTRRDWHKILGK